MPAVQHSKVCVLMEHPNLCDICFIQFLSTVRNVKLNVTLKKVSSQPKKLQNNLNSFRINSVTKKVHRNVMLLI